MKAALLADRGVVQVTGNVSGDSAQTFLNGLFTTDVSALTPEHPAYAALLTPQGKIIADFIAVATPDGVRLDCPRALARTLTDRIGVYKLRAKVTIEDLSDTLAVMAAWDGDAAPVDPWRRDPRLPALGLRAIVPKDDAGEAARALGAELVDAAEYEAHRIALGVPRGGVDFTYGDAFPHEADMDQLAGVDFAKGCYVGQEVVSRMQHRATARTRVVPVVVEGFGPEPGATVTAGDKTVGTMGSSAQGRGLALLRLDRLADALAAGTPLLSGGVRIEAQKPAWAQFAWPGEPKAAE